MLKRISRLRNAKINSVGIASVFQAGDTNEINMRIKVLADQRTIALYRDDEGSFNKKNTRSFGSRPSCRYRKRESKAHSAMKTLQFG